MPSVVFSSEAPGVGQRRPEFRLQQVVDDDVVGCSRLSKKFETPVSHELRRDGLVALRDGLQHRAVERIVERVRRAIDALERIARITFGVGGCVAQPVSEQ